MQTQMQCGHEWEWLSTMAPGLTQIPIIVAIIIVVMNNDKVFVKYSTDSALRHQHQGQGSPYNQGTRACAEANYAGKSWHV